MANPTGKGGAKKGEPSRNPSGRSKKRTEIEQLARRVVEGGPDELHGLEDLGRMARDVKNKAGDRKACWDTLLGYGYGKPTQRKEISGPDGGAIDFGGMTMAELEAKARILLDGDE